MHGFGREVDEGFDCRGRLAFAVRLQGFAERDEDKYHRRRFKVEVVRKVGKVLGVHGGLNHQRHAVYKRDCAAH